MTVDQAFENLMRRKTLGIPVAGAGAEDDAPRGGSAPAASASGRGKRREAVMPVAELLEDSNSDYLPPGPYGDVESSASHPTETDLEPVSDTAPADVGLGRTTARGGARHGLPTAAGAPGEISGLGRARLIRRFAYLPLEESRGFDSGARELMARVVSLSPDKPSLAVTSCRRGEGRTELSFRLALALAKRVESRVLLVDFDFRVPSLARRLGVSSKHFVLGDVLRRSCRLDDALVRSDEDNLYLLPARPLDRDGDDFLDGRQIKDVLSVVHGLFDFAVLDCGPVDLAATLAVARQAGATALAARMGVSSPSGLENAAAVLAEEGAQVSGMLLTG